MKKEKKVLTEKEEENNVVELIRPKLAWENVDATNWLWPMGPRAAFICMEKTLIQGRMPAFEMPEFHVKQRVVGENGVKAVLLHSNLNQPQHVWVNSDRFCNIFALVKQTLSGDTDEYS